MNTFNRRRFLARLASGLFVAAGGSAWAEKGAFAEELARTPWVEEGPFYPTKLPLDTDNDLLIINDALTPAVGTIAHLSGRRLPRMACMETTLRADATVKARPAVSSPVSAAREKSDSVPSERSSVPSRSETKS